MTNYLLFFGKSSDFTTYAFNENGHISDFDSDVFKDFDLLESRFLINDQLENEIVVAKYNFEYLSKNYSLLKIYGCAMATNADRISGSSYGIAFISELDISLSKDNISLLNSVRLKFKELAIENNRFIETSFFFCVEQIWSVFNTANYFQKIEVKGIPFVSSNSRPVPFLVENFDGLDKVAKQQIKISSKLYFTTDLEHIKRSIKYIGGEIPIFTISKGKAIDYSEIEKIEALEKIKLQTDGNDKTISNYENQSESSIKINSLILEKINLETSLKNASAEKSKIKSILFVLSLVLLTFIGLSLFLFINYTSIIEDLESKNNFEKMDSIAQPKNLPKEVYILKNWSGDIDLKSIGQSDNFISIKEYNKMVLKRIKPFEDKEGNIHSDKFVLKKGNSVPDFTIGKYGLIRRMTSEQKRNFK